MNRRLWLLLALALIFPASQLLALLLAQVAHVARHLVPHLDFFSARNAAAAVGTLPGALLQLQRAAFALLLLMHHLQFGKRVRGHSRAMAVQVRFVQQPGGGLQLRSRKYQCQCQ